MNVNLVKGQALVNQSKVNNWVDSFQKSFNEGLRVNAIAEAQEKAEKKAISTKVASYINSLSEPDLTNLTPEQNSAVTNFLVEQRNSYASLAKEITKIDASENPSEYAAVRDKMNGIKNSFSNLATQLNTYKEDKLSYLKDFDDKRISNGNSIGSLNEAAKIYTNEGSMSVGPGGQLVFFDDNAGDYKSYMEINKPFLKDFKTADSILKLNEGIYSSGQSLVGARKTMVQNKLKNLINSGGRDTLLSLATDDFLVDGGLNIQNKELFEPGNEDMLEQEVLAKYMDFLSETAAQGAIDKKPPSRPNSGGLSGALKDEVNLAAGAILPNALNFANLATSNPSPEEITAQINSIDPTARARPYITKGQLFEMFFEANGYDDDEIEKAAKDFTSQVEQANLYKYNPSSPGNSRPISLNINDPKALYDFYLKNSNLSSKATNYFIGNWNKYSGSTNKTKKTKTNNTGSGAYDNL